MLVHCDLCGNPVTIKKSKLIQLPEGRIEVRCFKCWTVSCQDMEFKPEEWEIEFIS